MRNSRYQGHRGWGRFATCALGLALCVFATEGTSLAAATSQPTSRPVKQAPPVKRLSARKAPTPRKKAKKAKKAKKGLAKKALKQWLVLGPALAPMPTFHKEKYGKFTHKQLLKSRFLQIERLWPKAGQEHHWFVGNALQWRKRKGKKTTFLAGKDTKTAKVAYLATYIEVDRYTEMTLKLRTHQRLQIFLDGKRVGGKASCTKLPKAKKGKKGKKAKKAKKPGKTKLAKKGKKATTPIARKAPPARKPALRPLPPTGNGVMDQLARLMAQQGRIIEQQTKTIARQSRWLARNAPKGKKGKKAKKPGKAQTTLPLTPGVHLLVLKTLYAPKCVAKWAIKASLHKKGKQTIPRSTRVATTPRERHSIGFLLRRAKIGGVSLSPDGKQVVLWKSRRTNAHQRITWVELRRTSDGKLLRSSRPHRSLRGLKWSPDGKHYSFVSAHGKRRGNTIWVVARSTGSVRALRRGIKQLGAYTWAPNSRFLLLNIRHKEKSSKIEKSGAKRLHGMGDRWPWYRTHNHLYRLTLQGGQLFRLTAGRSGVWGANIRQDGKKLLFARTMLNTNTRPFRNIDLYELDLGTLKARLLLKNLRWLNGFSYTPDGKQILMRGGASLFGTLGRSPGLANGVLPNEYDTQAYLYDIKTRKKQALTRSFNPSIRSLHWHKKDNNIYAVALDGTRYKLFRYTLATKTWAHINTGVDLTYRVSFARSSLQSVFLGQGLTHPGRLFSINLASAAKPKLIHAPAKAWLGRLTLAKVKDFVTTSRRGHRIEGRVYYPPNFDKRKKYPAIVYYYGGTFPTTRGFDGRYPGHLWAANGFIVYKLQPSGAIGYGQRFAARHVNEWGTIVPEEIIDATKDFLKAHKFVDPKRLGCLGASYGGFTTMSIVTKSSLFAAAISHAGISNITSYWGAGFWGYLYSAIAGAKRYPWTHPYFYAKQSPVFSANKVTTPLLLLHGDSDTNVPPSESFQMYAALRLLKKKVEIVLFKRENHWILRYKKRILWTRTILAWFDRHLKKQPLWWKRLHGTRQH